MIHRVLPWAFAALALGLGCAEDQEVADPTTQEAEVKGPPTDTGPQNANAAPVLSPIGDRVVLVGETLGITMVATDPEGDPLTYTIVGQLPEGARFLKEEHRFEWTPEVAGVVSYLTFVVTDGTEFDRETVRIEVTAFDTNHPPALALIGDQIGAVASQIVIQLSATDPDGDSLTYGLTGDVPSSATFDPYQGHFSWTPGLQDEGSQRQITFSVSDGELEDAEQITLVVGAAGQENPTPPVFDPVAPKEAVAGETLSFPVTATVPGEGKAEVGIHANAPPGAGMAAGLFTWTPGSADIGLSWAVTFSAKASGLTAYLTVDIVVISGGGETKCTDDPGEPNETPAQATPLAPGTLEASICDTTLVPVDSDVYAMNLAPGQTLSATLGFDPLDGDLELEVVNEAMTALAIGNSVGAEESVSWTSAGGGTAYVLVYGIAQAVFHSPYVLTVAIEDDGPCIDDAYEPNNTDVAPPDLPGATEELSLCPGDTDWWSVLLFCGETVLFTLDAGGTGDLDMYLWDPDNPGDGLLASGATGALLETLEVTSVPHTGDYLLKVVGWPPGVGGGSYTITPEYSGACFDTGVSDNHDAATAWPLAGATGTLDEQRLCCDDDWYLLTIGQGQTALVDVQVTSSGGWAGVTVYAPGATQPIASGTPSASGSLVEVQAGADGVYVIQIDGSAGTDYDLSWIVQ